MVLHTTTKLLAMFGQSLQEQGISKAMRIGLAVSGGPDSLALAFLAATWAPKADPRPVALIVDHGLREESSREAIHARRVSQKLGLHADVIKLAEGHVWPQSPGKLMQHARERRYQALWEACRQHDIPVLVTGHHADDQAEGFLIRFSKASGIDGLAGIQASTEWTGGSGGGSKLLVRPLLHARKAELVQLCQEQKIPFCTDPTNADTRYIRNRIRKLLSAHPGNKDSFRPMMASHLRSRTGSMEISQIPSRCFPALSGEEQDTGAKRATDAFTVETMASRDELSGVESESCDPDLISDLLRLNQACNIVKAINEQRAIEVVQQMLQEGNEWRQRRVEGQARTQADAKVQNLSAPRSAVDMPNFKGGFKGSLLPVPPSSEGIAAEWAAPGTSTAQGVSLPMPERKDWLSDGSFISLQPLRGCTDSLGVRIVCILFKDGAVRNWSQARTGQIWLRLRQGSIRNSKNEVPRKDVHLAGWRLRPVWAGHGKIVQCFQDVDS